MDSVKNTSSLRLNPGYFLSLPWIVPVVLIAIVFASKAVSLLLFHTIAELFSIVVAMIMIVVAWQMYPFTRNHYLMFLGCGYFWVAVLDSIHTLVYEGMTIVNFSSTNYAVQYWISARYYESIVLLISPLLLTRSLNRITVFVIMGVIAILITASISAGLFPRLYIDGSGLTAYKIYSEYIIIGILAAAIGYLWHKRNLIEIHMLGLLIGAMCLTMISELSFTFYVGIYDLSNVVGHVVKILSYWLIFMAMVKTTLQEPFKVLSSQSTTYDAMPDATLLVDEDGLIRQCNDAASRLSGISKERLISLSSHDVFHHTEDKEKCAICNARLKGDKKLMVEVFDQSKTSWFDISISPVSKGKNIVGAVEVVRDITIRKETEVELYKVNELKNSILQNLPVMLFVKADDMRFVEWNREAERITGLKKSDVIGKNDFDLFVTEEAEKYTLDDKVVIESGVLKDIPKEQIHNADNEIVYLHTRKIPIFNKITGKYYLLGISQDITDSLRISEMLQQSQKMEAIGKLSGGIAHDFNNQLGVVLGYLEFIDMTAEPDDKLKSWIENAMHAANRCVDLTKQLLLFSRKKSNEGEVFNLNELLEKLKNIIAKTVTPEIEVKYRLQAEQSKVLVNSGEFEDAMINLVINARDAMQGAGYLNIASSNIYLDTNEAVTLKVEPGEYVKLSISDTGMGMSAEVQAKIFEPFYTTKSEGKGTGLGLAMVYGFVTRNQGAITVESGRGTGTTFNIYLPVPSSQLEEKDIASDNINPLKSGSETILAVDDEPELLSLTQTYLESYGYHVIATSQAKEAINVIGKQKIDLVFSDVIMPGGMSGYDLARFVSEEYPDIKVLLTSGYNDEVKVHSESPDKEFPLLDKPFSRIQLAEKVRTVLDE